MPSNCPNKIGLPREEYFIVQKAYRGWNLPRLAPGGAGPGAARRRDLGGAAGEWRVMVFTLLALTCVLAAQGGVFWTFTYPANVATANWTILTG